MTRKFLCNVYEACGGIVLRCPWRLGLGLQQIFLLLVADNQEAEKLPFGISAFFEVILESLTCLVAYEGVLSVQLAEITLKPMMGNCKNLEIVHTDIIPRKTRSVRGKMKKEENPGRMIAVFNAMSLMISSNWEGWEIHSNIKGYCAEPKIHIPVENVGVFRDGKLITFCQIPHDADGAKLMKEICGAFCLAIEQEEKKHVRKEKDWRAVSESH